MITIRVKNGLDLPISGAPDQQLLSAKPVQNVALMGGDYIGMKPNLQVAIGDRVRLGQTLFIDRKKPEIRYTSPAGGTVSGIHRGEKRRLLSLVVEIDDSSEEEERFPDYQDADITKIPESLIRENLIQSGLWTSLRARPYNLIPRQTEIPHSIFVTAMDSNPLAMNPTITTRNRIPFLKTGLLLLNRLTPGPLYICTKKGDTLTVPEIEKAHFVEFAGPHPAGLPGTHIHFLDPVNENKSVWFVHLQDVIAMGILFQTGRLNTERIISLAGPRIKQPRLLKTRIGANIPDLVEGEIQYPETSRVISGSVLSGRKLDENETWLGRYHHQVSVLSEGGKRELLTWLLPGKNRFSIRKAFMGSLRYPKRQFDFTTSMEGSERAMVPIGMYEQVMPLDILPTFLLRALITGDNEQAHELGCLELDEEDIALCSYVSPGKTDYGPILRKRLGELEREI